MGSSLSKRKHRAEEKQLFRYLNLRDVSIENIGSTCYVSTVLFSLCLGLDAFHRFLRPEEKDGRRVDPWKTNLQRTIIECFWEPLRVRSSVTAAHMGRLMDALWTAGWNVAHGLSMDVGEFLQFLMDSLDAKRIVTCSQRIVHGCSPVDGDDGTETPMGMITLPCPTPPHADLELMIDTWFNENFASATRGDPNAKQVPVMILYRLENVPSVIPVYLSRTIDATTKSRDPVVFPQTINFFRYIRHGDMDERLLNIPWVLKSVIAHHGAHAHGGHYVCYIRSPFNHTDWLEMDDTRRRSVRSTRNVFTDGFVVSNGVLFFYEIDMEIYMSTLDSIGGKSYVDHDDP